MNSDPKNRYKFEFYRLIGNIFSILLHVNPCKNMIQSTAA